MELGIFFLLLVSLLSATSLGNVINLAERKNEVPSQAAQTSMRITEGRLAWQPPNAGKPCSTWYRIYGDLKSPGRPPLIVLHGGPGVTSDYLSIVSDLTLRYQTPVVIYDQLGNGQSTHLPEKVGDDTFWTEDLFLHELKLLLEYLHIYDNYHILGHSWGGMLGMRHAVHQPGGLKRLVLMSTPASNPLWIDAQNEWRALLPADVQEVLTRNEQGGTTDSQEYQDAVNYYFSLHLCTINPMPDEIAASFAWLDKDPTVYSTMNGPSEFFFTGSLQNWTIIPEAQKIKVPTLLTNGLEDEARDVCVSPLFDLIPNVRWVHFANSSHMAHFEERDKFFTVVGEFLTEVSH